MTNEEIKSTLDLYQEQLKHCDMATFELHEQVSNIQKEMARLRHMCSHKNGNSEFELLLDGRCRYCGQIVREDIH